MVDVAREVAHCFEEVVLVPPKLLEPRVLADQFHCARLRLVLWPRETWLIDRELLPRLRRRLEQDGLAVNDDKVAVCYGGRPT
jgi:hypothetical protein